MKRSCLVSLLAMLSAAVLSGCAATAQGDLSATSPSADQASDGPAPTALPRHRARSGPRALSDLADPLLDAPYQTLVHCEAEDPPVSGEKLGSVRLICHSLRVSATLTEFRDAGWRIEDIHMTESKTPEGIITIPFSVSLRKLF